MGFSYFLKTSEDVESFKVRFNVPCDINISYCHEGEIQDQKLPHIVFFPFMSILEGGVRFPIDPLLLKTLSFYGLNPDQCLPNFYRDVNYVGRLNRLYGLNLTHYDNNFLYAIQGSLKNEYYLQTRNTMIKFISCPRMSIPYRRPYRFGHRYDIFRIPVNTGVPFRVYRYFLYLIYIYISCISISKGPYNLFIIFKIINSYLIY